MDEKPELPPGLHQPSALKKPPAINVQKLDSEERPKLRKDYGPYDDEADFMKNRFILGTQFP